jgi:hypothetical protein|tara:strand:- start:7201 stop:7782 length:582 start_codon:yes stop_codon:yes gene_type:complete
MAQTSLTISGQKTFKSAITVTEGCTFTSTSGTNKIAAASTSLAALSVRDLITITGTTSNNATFTVKSVDSNGTFITVEETVTAETSDGSTDTVLTYSGFVTDKFKGDGYYSQTDGNHTVAYHVTTSCTGSIKMQGSLATTPTEDDYFDIDGTTFTTDQSTTISSVNFTGNFVWVRAKCTDNTAGAVSKILYNN